MKREQRSKSVGRGDAIPQRRKAERIVPAVPVSTPLDPELKRIYLNADGALAITKAGSRKIQTTFMGSIVVNEPSLQDCTDLENARLSQLAGALPYGSGQVGNVQALNIGMDAVATLLPRDGMEVMLCSQLVALHSQGMEFLRRGMIADQTVDGVDRNVIRATKLLRTFERVTVGSFVSYCRVSMDKQGKTGLGLDAQREAVTRFLAGRGDLATEFVEVESGPQD